MTDEELAVLILETRDRLRGPAWLSTDEQPHAWRSLPRAREHMTAVVRDVRHRLESSQREQTAATILAALWVNEPDPYGRIAQLTTVAVELADDLRARLAKVKP